MNPQQQLYLGLAIVVGILVVVFFLKDRITAFSARYGKGRLDIKASEPEPTRAGVRVQGVEAGPTRRLPTAPETASMRRR